MTIIEISEKLALRNLTPEIQQFKDVQGGYTSDLLSDVMGNSKEGQVWITVQSHMNIIAVASLKDLPAIIIVNGNIPDEEVLKKAISEKIPVFSTRLNSFEITGQIYNLLH